MNSWEEDGRIGGTIRHIAVLDVGKTNIKLAIAEPDGRIVEQASTANVIVTKDGETWGRHDLRAAEAWLMNTLARFAERFAIDRFVASGHGSAGVLVSPGDLAREEPLLPMIDYEGAPPPDVDAEYRRDAGDFLDRGSAIMHAATHQARQILWVEREQGEAFRGAAAFLGVPQYWAWRLCGARSAEITCLAAQSDLWNAREKRASRIVSQRGWHHLLPELRPAFASLGPIRPDVAERTGLPRTCEVLVGIHDSSANFYRYQAAGLSRMTVVSTGTWIVALSDHGDLAALDPDLGMTLNADVDGRPLAGTLTMGGREFAAIAGDGARSATASLERIRALVERRCFALPSFGQDDGLFPGSAGKGRIIGPPPADAGERMSLAVLTAALLTNECLTALANCGTIILDGAFLKDPLYASLVASLNHDTDVLFSREANGVAAGAALLATHGRHERPVSTDLETAKALSIDGLAAYAREWRRMAHSQAQRPGGPGRATSSTGTERRE